MLGVTWRDRAMLTCARCATAATSSAWVFACTVNTRCEFACNERVLVTALPGVARKPITSRPASGPMDTGGACTGLYSRTAAAVAPHGTPHASAHSTAISLPVMQRILFNLLLGPA